MNNNDIENNKYQDPLYRLYRRDKYENTIDVIQSPTGIESTLTLGTTLSHNYKMNPVQSIVTYIEFIKSNGTYNLLLGGSYTLKITHQGKPLTRVIILSGDSSNSSDTVAKNQKINLEKTVISDAKLSFAAGDNGYIVIELRTEMNTKYIMSQSESKTFFISVVSCDSQDKTFKATKFNMISERTFFISITTNKSNTFPNVTSCPLKVTISGSLISSLKPEILVYPSVLKEAIVYDKDILSSLTLKPGKADIPYQFRVIGKDKYGNIVKVSEAALKISIRNNGNIAFDYESSVDVTTGYQNYVVSLTQVNTYKITAGINEDQENLFKVPYTVTITFGAISIERIENKVNNPIIAAGESATFIIIAKDKHGNMITPETVKNNFVVTVKTPNEITTVIPGTLQNQEIRYVEVLKEKGINEWIVSHNKNKIDCIGCNTFVNPNQCNPSNSLIYGKNLQGIDTLKLQADPLYSSNSNSLTFTVALRDNYMNIIDIVTNNYVITDAVMSGHSMFPITFLSKITADNSRLEMLLPNDPKTVRAFDHLVERKGYKINFKVKNNIKGTSADFIRNVDHETARNDSNYANGYYNIEKSYFTKELSIRVNEEVLFDFNLKTIDNDLLYNDDIDLTLNKDISYQLSKPNTKFKCIFSKSSNNYAEYKGTFSTTEVTAFPDKYILSILITDPLNPTSSKREIGRILFEVNIDVLDASKTIVIEKPELKISSNKPIILKFNLFDKYNNIYRSKDVSDQLTLRQNNIEELNVLKTFIGENVYLFSFTPKYPPRNIELNIEYKQNNYVGEIFFEPIKTEIVSTYNPKKTKIFGKNLKVMQAGEKIDLNAIIFDDGGVCINTDTAIEEMLATINGPFDNPQTYVYDMIKNPEDPSSMCKLSYTAKVPDDKVYTTAGIYTITVSIGGENIQTLIQTVTNTNIDSTKYTASFNQTASFNPETIKPQEIVSIIIQGYDKYKNKITDRSINKLLAISNQIIF